MPQDQAPKLETLLQTWSNQHDDVDFIPEVGVFKLSWPMKSSRNRGYIDVSPDPKRRDMVVVQHGTIDSTERNNPCGITRWYYHELDQRLDDLKQSVETTTQPIRETWKYTPKIEIGNVKGFRF